MARPFYLVDAFVNGPFTGNPAAVVLLNQELDPSWMQDVAMEANQAETSFVWPLDEGRWGLRWFTPTVEVGLCGHATLAAAHVLWESGRAPTDRPVTFLTSSGALVCSLEGGLVAMVFPSEGPHEAEPPFDIAPLLGFDPVWMGKNGRMWVAMMSREQAVRTMRPDMAAVKALGMVGLCVTAKADTEGFDIVSRFFAPQSGVPEDHATGSAHCALAPFWGEKLNKTSLTALQLSPRRAVVSTEWTDGRVVLRGRAVTTVLGSLNL
jgi:PhzF family phenazine biosynthesis protein